ncbi:MAG: hypothetical protein NWE98_07760 [Candidatus Bathyarchaeota archaeon]|nr:hypothetical protein [Candidatus Bathyarchaeota archaeon]
MNENRLKIGLVATVLIAVAILAAFWAMSMFPQPPFEPRRIPGQGGYIPGDFEFFYVAFTIISTINIAMLVILLLTYINIYSKTRSPFTVGLIIFATVFLIKDFTSSPIIAGLFSFRAVGLGPFVFLPGILEFAALSVLLYLSIRY